MVTNLPNFLALNQNKFSTPIKVPRFTAQNGYTVSFERSLLMSKIKGKDTTPEILFRKCLFALGIRYRKNVRKLPGKPDILITKHRMAIFIDGEFWHGYDWPNKKKKIKNNRHFWIQKIERNIQRDLENKTALNKLGFTVIRFWQHEIERDLSGCLIKVILKIPSFTQRSPIRNTSCQNQDKKS